MILATHGILGSSIVQFTGLLDDYSGAAAAYSLRLLRASYTGDAIRVRRASDNTEQDIGFVSGELDTSTLTTFCSGTDGFVKTWYDQSGNGNDASQTTASEQPQIVSSGSVILENGKPSLNFDGTNDGLTNSSSFTYGNSMSVLSVFNQPTSNNNSRIICDDITGVQGYFILFGTSTNASENNKFLINDGGGYTFISHQSVTTNNQTMLNIFFSSTQMIDSLNGNAQTTSVSGFSTPINSSGSANIGIANSGNLTNPTTINMQELIVYSDSDQSSNRTGIETNINDFYSIY